MNAATKTRRTDKDQLQPARRYLFTRMLQEPRAQNALATSLGKALVRASVHYVGAFPSARRPAPDDELAKGTAAESTHEPTRPSWTSDCRCRAISRRSYAAAAFDKMNLKNLSWPPRSMWQSEIEDGDP